METALPDLPHGVPPVLGERYALLRELGRGGMAEVYLARDLETNARVAVKVLSAELAPLLGADRFAREIRITSSLHHPGILQVLDSGKVDGRPYYVMPYVEGESLAARLGREGQLSIEQAIVITRQIAQALAAAHREGFVHRDIKPGNVLLSGEDTFLADFGIARAIDMLTNDRLTESGVALGTASYMSPEQAAGGRVDGRSDLYSLGCLLFEMLAGSPPFSGVSSQSIRARHMVDPVPSLHTVRTTVPPSLERVVVKAMAKVPADRYAGAEQFLEALDRVDLSDTTSGPVVAPRRARWLPGAVALLLALGLASAAWWRLSGRGARLDTNRVMVFPLTVPPDLANGRTAGEDISTMIGNALDGAGQLRWVDAWPLLAPAQRDNIRNLALEEARRLAGSKRCAFYVSGRLVARGDSTEVFLDLNDVRGDSVVARGRATGTTQHDWRLGLTAVNDVLPALIPSGSPNLEVEWKARDPAAVASFLRGEAAFRRLHLGDALARYKEAVQADSGFALAAVRAAQAATWSHRTGEAAALITRALQLPLSPRYRHFALGYSAYLEGWADSAASELRRAIGLDGEMTVAWMQLGEVYTHLLPAAGPVDSLAEDAFQTAYRLDPRALNLHLVEILLRRSDTAGAAPLLRAFLAAKPDSIRHSLKLRLMDACVRRGPSGVNWRSQAQASLITVLTAGSGLAAAGAQPACADAALAATIEADTSRAGDDRWFALLMRHALLLGEGRTKEAMAAIDAVPAGDEASRMYLLDASLYPATAGRASEVARSYQQRCGSDYRKCGNSYVVWQLAIWAIHAGDSAPAAAAAGELRFRADTTGNVVALRAARILARSAEAHAALAASDTGTALALLDSLLQMPVPGNEEIQWNIALPRGLDRLVFARLLFTRGDYRRALAVADVFDSPAPSVYLLYLPESLRLRADAAAALGERSLADAFRSRLAAFRGSTTVASHAVSPSSAGGVQ